MDPMNQVLNKRRASEGQCWNVWLSKCMQCSEILLKNASVAAFKSLELHRKNILYNYKSRVRLDHAGGKKCWCCWHGSAVFYVQVFLAHKVCVPLFVRRRRFLRGTVASSNCKIRTTDLLHAWSMLWWKRRTQTISIALFSGSARMFGIACLSDVISLVSGTWSKEILPSVTGTPLILR